MIKWILKPILARHTERLIQVLADKAPTKTLTAREILRNEAMKLEYK